MEVVENNYFLIVKFLVECKVDINVWIFNGFSVMDLVKEYGSKEFISFISVWVVW